MLNEKGYKMTKFAKENFSYSGGYLNYFDGTKSHFVARFKYAKGDKAPFQSFLIKNFSVEEYFELMKSKSPLEILQSKGYVQSHVKRILKQLGYELTLAGQEKYIADRVAQYSQKA